MLTGELPYDGEDFQEIYEKNKKGKIKFDHPSFKHHSKNLKDLIKNMLKIDPMERLSAKQCLEHPHFEELRQKKKKLEEEEKKKLERASFYFKKESEYLNQTSNGENFEDD